MRSNATASIGFLLLDELSLDSMSSAVDPLRYANQLAGRKLYTWDLLAYKKSKVRASNGIEILTEEVAGTRDRLHNYGAVFVCSGANVERYFCREVTDWLRAVASQAVDLGAISTGSFVLAQSGLLDGFRCSIRSECVAVLSSAFPSVYVSGNRFTIDRNRFSCSGGTATLDMMLYLIETSHGEELRFQVSDRLRRERASYDTESEFAAGCALAARRSEALQTALELMEANLAEPVEIRDISNYCGKSTRQIQRLFRNFLSHSPTSYYMNMRLHRARDLLRTTGCSIIEVSELTGFRSASHFSKTYRRKFGRPPSHDRNLGNPMVVQQAYG